MSYRKKFVKPSEQWNKYCAEHQDLIDRLNLDSRIFETEENFREYCTYGTVQGSANGLQQISNIQEEMFVELFRFITNFFDFDASDFTQMEERRLGM